MGRPVTIYTPEKIAEIKADLDNYIDNTWIPIVAEFAYTRDIRKAVLYEKPELAYSLKRLIEKKESQLEKLAMANKINITFAIFSLKQLGWSDRREIDHSGSLSVTFDSQDEDL
jgi:hypothetical protein